MIEPLPQTWAITVESGMHFAPIGRNPGTCLGDGSIEMTAEPSPPSLSVVPPRTRSRAWDRFVLGAMLALALFLVEAGSAEVLLARDADCRAHELPPRFGSVRQSVCLGSGEVALLRSLSRGLDRPLASEVDPSLPWAAWILNGAVYALLGGLSAQLPRLWGAALLLGLNVVIVSIMTILRFLAPFIG